jgi:hypothetical protein
MNEADTARWNAATTAERRQLFRDREHCDRCGALVLPLNKPGSVWTDYHCPCGNAWLNLSPATQRQIARAIRSTETIGERVRRIGR